MSRDKYPSGRTNILLAKALDSVESESSLEMYQLNLVLDANPYLYSLQSSLEIQISLTGSQEIPMKAHKLSESFDSLEELHEDTLIETNKENINTNVRNSTIYTNLSSDSSRLAFSNVSEQRDMKVEESKQEHSLSPGRKQPNRPKLMSEKSLRASFYGSGIGLPTKVFCTHCERETNSIAIYESKKLGFWGNLWYIFSSVKCCSDPNSIRKYQNTVRKCANCWREVKI